MFGRPAPAAGVSTFFRLRQDHLVAPAVLPPVSCARLTIATLRAHAARPLLNGFRSTDAITEPSGFSVRIHRSKYSLCQNPSPDQYIFQERPGGKDRRRYRGGGSCESLPQPGSRAPASRPRTYFLVVVVFFFGGAGSFAAR